MLKQNSITKRNIYLADDDEDDRLIFEDALSEVDPEARLTKAVHGEELIKLLSPPDLLVPDVLFLDINMPIKSGFDCLDDIRNHLPHLQHLTVVMLSTCNLPETIEKSLSMGADFYAVKPASFFDLKKLISNVLDGLSDFRSAKRFLIN